VRRSPEDPEARRLWLERWGAEQEARLGQPLSRQLRMRFAARTAQLAKTSEKYAERAFDRRLGTASGVSGWDEREHAHVDQLANVPSAWHVLPRALRCIGASDRDTFVDFGCGQGRIVHQAAKWPLRRVVGVEMHPPVAELARALLAAHSDEHRCPNVEILVCDAAQFQVPDDLTIAYLFDPFRGRTFDAVLQRIIESIDRRPRGVRLIYVHPVRAASILATQRFRLLKQLRGGLRDVRISRAAIFESC
jgi:SAM-dependent methyltransferase